MSYTSNQINSQSLNGIISLSDGVLNIEDGIISNIQSLKVVGDSELDGNLIVDGKISCDYNALLPSDVVNKNYVDDALNNNSRFLRVDGTNKMNANLNVGDKYIYNLLDPSGNQDASTKFYTDTADNLRLLKSGGIMTGNLDMSGNSITNVASVSNLTQLDLQIGSSLILQLQSNQTYIRVPLIFSLVSGGVGINLNGSNINYCGSILGYTNTNLVLSYYNGVSPKISLTSGRTLFTDGLKISNIGIDMSGNSITNLSAGVSDTDCVNKLQMVNADNLRLLKSGDTMTGILDLSANRIIKLATGIDDTDCVNKLQMVNADNLRLLKAGDTMTGHLNMNQNNIININNLASATSTYLHLLIGNTILMQLTPEQVVFKAPILINGIASGGTGIYMAGTKIANLSDATNPQDAITKQQMDNADNLRLLKGGDTMSGGLNMGGNIITNLPYPSSDPTDAINRNYCDTEDNKRLRLDGNSLMTGNINCNGNNITNIGSIQSQINSNLNLQSGTTTIMQIQPLKVLMSMPIDMNSKLINGLGNGVATSDAVNKGQLDLKLNLGGGTLSGQLIFSGGGIDMSTYNMNNVSFIKSSGITPIYLSIDNVSKVKIDSSGLTMQNSGYIDMGGNNIKNVSNINSNGINPLILQHNSVPIVQIDASGITMQYAADINMNGGEISNASLIMPIKTSTTSSYSTINSNYLNIGFTSSKSYNSSTVISPSTATRLLGTSGTPAVNNKLSVAPGVWIITAMFNPFCISGNPDSSRIQLYVSNVSTATPWTAFPASNCHQMLNGQYASGDSTRMVNTFVIHLTESSTDLYLWGIVDYSGGPAWQYDFAELRATRIA
jgi:hypothetical protein